MAKDRGSKPDGLAGDDPHHDVAGALHDVSNALTVVLGWVAEARAEGASPESIAFSLETIETQARFARDLARRAIGGAVAEADDALEGILNRALAALRLEAAHRGVEIVVASKPREKSTRDVHEVSIVPTMRIAQPIDVAQILTNLILNALAYTPRGTEVTIEIASFDAKVQIDVSDRGPGVPASRAESIFEGDSTRTGGAGLGLRYSRDLARAAGGDLALLPSTSGARFRLTWPRASQIPLPPVSVPRARLLEGQRILLLEDDVAVTQLLEAALGGRGAELTIAHNRAEFASAIAAGPHDIALIDLSPIAADATAAFAAVRARSPHVRLFVVTGSADSVPDVEGIRVLRKPFEVGEIVTALVESRPLS